MNTPKRPPQIRTFATMTHADEAGADYVIYRGRVSRYGTAAACFDWEAANPPQQLSTVRVEHHDHPRNLTLSQIHAFYAALAAPYATDAAPLCDWEEITGRTPP